MGHCSHGSAMRSPRAQRWPGALEIALGRARPALVA